MSAAPKKGGGSMSYAFIAVLSILAALKWGKVKNWRAYYPTILYFFVGNLTYMVLTKDKPLWNFGEAFGKSPVFEITMMVLLYPSTTILFLSLFPQSGGRMKRVRYYALSVLIFSAMEYLAHITGGFSYNGGWNIFYSVIFNAIMFPMLYLHFKIPLLAWPISTVLAFAFLYLFGITF
jgi:hypothetical protein